MAKVNLWRRAAVALARGDLVAARRWADDAVARTTGWHRAVALTMRARVAIAQGDTQQAERDAHASLTAAVEVDARLGIPDTLECLAVVARDAGSHQDGARLFGAADGIRERVRRGALSDLSSRIRVAVDLLRQAMEQNDFDNAWAEGAQLSTDEAIAYARRGRGERKRPDSGWESLTPAEHDVVRLVCEGLGNKEVGTSCLSPLGPCRHILPTSTRNWVSTPAFNSCRRSRGGLRRWPISGCAPTTAGLGRGTKVSPRGRLLEQKDYVQPGLGRDWIPCRRSAAATVVWETPQRAPKPRK